MRFRHSWASSRVRGLESIDYDHAVQQVAGASNRRGRCGCNSRHESAVAQLLRSAADAKLSMEEVMTEQLSSTVLKL